MTQFYNTDLNKYDTNKLNYNILLFINVLLLYFVFNK